MVWVTFDDAACIDMHRIYLAHPLPLHTLHLICHRLFPVGPGADFHGGVDPRGAHGMDFLVAGFDRGHDRIPFSLNRGAVGMQGDGKAGLIEDVFAGGDVLGQRNADPDGYDADINDNVHDPPVYSEPTRKYSRVVVFMFSTMAVCMVTPACPGIPVAIGVQGPSG